MSPAAPRKSATAKGTSPHADKPSKVSSKTKPAKTGLKSAPAVLKSAPVAAKAAPAAPKSAPAALKTAASKSAPAVKAAVAKVAAVAKIAAASKVAAVAKSAAASKTTAPAKKAPASSSTAPVSPALESMVVPKSGPTTKGKEREAGRPDRFARTARRADADPESAVLPVLTVDFAVGEVAVHPAHGVGRIASIEERDFGGTNSQVYVLHIAGSGLRVMVPKGTAARVGLRPVMTAAEADSILQVLATPEVAVSMQPWNRRFRAYTEMIASGSATEIAKVLRDMHRLKFDKELSFGERRLLDQAKGLLVQELALAKDQRAEEMESAIEQIFAA